MKRRKKRRTSVKVRALPRRGRQSGPSIIRNITSVQSVDLMAHSSPSRDLEERKIRGEQVLTELDRIVCGRFSEAERRQWLEGASDAALWNRFEDALIEQVEVLTWRVFESSGILEVIRYWIDQDPLGVEKLKRFNKNLERGARIRRGLKRVSFSAPEWPSTRKSALREVKALQRKVSAQFAVKNATPTITEAYVVIRKEVTGTPAAYRYLTQNWTSLMRYLKRQDNPVETTSPLTLRFATGQVTAATLVDGWFDYQGNAGQGKSRQAISRTCK